MIELLSKYAGELIGALAASGLISVWIKKLIKYLKSRKGYNIYEISKRDVKVLEKLTELRFLFDADRVSLIQFKNGGYYLNNVPELKLFCTHESKKENVSSLIDRLSGISISHFSELFSQYFNDFKPHSYEVDKLKYKNVKIILSELGIFYIAFGKLLNKNNQIQGYLQVEYLHDINDKQKEFIEKNLDKIQDTAIIINLILKGMNDGEKSTDNE